MKTAMLYGPMPEPLPPLQPPAYKEPDHPDLKMPFGRHKGERYTAHIN